MSLLSKPTALGVPVILVILDIYPLRRWSGRNFNPDARGVWLEKLPFVICALAAAPLALWVKAEAGVVMSRLDLVVALRAPVFYLSKLLAPVGLSLYERPLYLYDSYWQLLTDCAVVPVSTVLLVANRRNWPAGLAVWVCYLVLLAPTLGLVRFGVQIAADRYAYLPSLGWSTLAGGGMLGCWQAWQDRRLHRLGAGLVAGLTVVVLLGLGVLTWRQARVWHDSETFWQHVLGENPDSVSALNNLGMVLAESGRFDEAGAHFERALRLRPNNAKFNNNWGLILARRGQLDQATHYFRRAIELSPRDASAHSNLAKALASQGRYDEAIEHFRTALQLDPTLADAERSLNELLGRTR